MKKLRAGNGKTMIFKVTRANKNENREKTNPSPTLLGIDLQGVLQLKSNCDCEELFHSQLMLFRRDFTLKITDHDN